MSLACLILSCRERTWEVRWLSEGVEVSSGGVSDVVRGCEYMGVSHAVTRSLFRFLVCQVSPVCLVCGRSQNCGVSPTCMMVASTRQHICLRLPVGQRPLISRPVSRTRQAGLHQGDTTSATASLYVKVYQPLDQYLRGDQLGRRTIRHVVRHFPRNDWGVSASRERVIGEVTYQYSVHSRSIPGRVRHALRYRRVPAASHSLTTVTWDVR
jgi:hypothetical protein